jgi:hypothetical protein
MQEEWFQLFNNNKWKQTEDNIIKIPEEILSQVNRTRSGDEEIWFRGKNGAMEIPKLNKSNLKNQMKLKI